MDQCRKEKMLEAVMIEHGDALVRLAFHYVKNKEVAKDMVQNAFIKCYEKLDTFRYDSSLRTWLYRITINQCKDYLKSWHYKQVSVKEAMEQTLRSAQVSIEENIIKGEEEEQFKQLIFSLPIKYREVIYLYYYESLSTPEISQVTGLKENTIKTRLRRAKAKLKVMFEEVGIYG
ncbi:sigma-70 family RNA polymerase sigma factor [Paraliobacillus ryukyuensis]|uniref:sigma-70 family RNA polymerase sigma factor n=1 Tax=Paraliobacillus ryukyuensis TaxID=200904 RepID=UPI0009A670E7|nr:sigma-70 family RNA polymerase sigma factor [Paraliobacillus ryukyuensis]